MFVHAHEMLPGFYVTHSFPRIVQMQGTKGRGVRARGSPRCKRRRVYVPLRSPSLSFHPLFFHPCTSMYLESPPPAFNNQKPCVQLKILASKQSTQLLLLLLHFGLVDLLGKEREPASLGR